MESTFAETSCLYSMSYSGRSLVSLASICRPSSPAKSSSSQMLLSDTVQRAAVRVGHSVVEAVNGYSARTGFRLGDDGIINNRGDTSRALSCGGRLPAVRQRTLVRLVQQRIQLFKIPEARGHRDAGGALL